MTCGLNDEDLFVLNLLYSNRCLRSDRGYHSAKLARLFRVKFEEDVEDTVKRLVNKGYLSPIGKSPPKYYIADKPLTFFALGQHGYSVTPGRIKSL